MSATRVLIVDDVPDVRQELSLLLSLSGDIAVVGEAANGVEALRQAEALHPDVIVIDLEMPVMDGCEAARRIKMRLPGCRVIALSIHDSQESREECALAGVDAFLTKGDRMDVLLETIHPSDERKEGDTI